MHTAALAAVLLLVANAACFAAFPPVLVIDGTAYPGAQVSGNSGAWKYVTGNGVLILYGATGGDTAWGATENAALTSPSATSTWDGGLNVWLTGHTLIVPQVLVTYPGSVTPAALQGYDGNQHQAAGSGTINGKFVVAYNDGLPDGYIFNFGDGLPIYRYQYGPNPVSIDKSNGWPPPNVFIFPSQITVGGQTLTVTSYTNGLDNGYWANAYYEGNNVFGHLSAYVAPDGSGGQLYGNVNGSDVSASWDSGTHTFVASPSLGIGFDSLSNAPVTAVGSPQHGPPQVELDGTLVPFAFNDASGSDVYWNQSSGAWVLVGSNDSVTTSNGYSCSYDPGSNMFSVYFSGWLGSSGNLAAVSADGTTFLGTADGIKGYNISPGMADYCIGYGQGYFVNNPSYYFTQPSGNRAEYFVASQCGVSGVFVFQGWWYTDSGFSPSYLYTGGIKVIDAANGWPAGDVPSLPTLPYQIYLNGYEFDDSGYCWGMADSGVEMRRFYATPYSEGGGALYMYARYNDDGTFSTWFSIQGGQPPGFPSNGCQFNQGVMMSGAGLSTDGSVYLNFTPSNTPQYGPARILWNNISYGFTTTQNGVDTYVDPSSGNQVFIDSTHHVTASGSSVSGTYTSNGYHFDIAGMVAQDANGNLLGTAPGVVIIFSGTPGTSSPWTWPGGTYGQGGQSIQLADGTYRNPGNTTVYTVARNDGTWLVKYAGIPANSLFMVQDGSGNYSSPVYCYSGDSDCVIDTTSPGDWPAAINLYPATLYINGHAATIDTSSAYLDVDMHSGVTYLASGAGGSFTIDWTWDNNGLHATVSGSYGNFVEFTGTWDGNLFGGLPNGLVISTLPPHDRAQYGSAQVIWNGVQLLYDPLASSVSGSNPTGADIYHDSLGLGLQVTVNSDGSVAVRRSNGTTYSGTYNSSAHRFQFSNSAAVGSVQAANNQGIIYPTGGDAPPVLTGDTTDIPGNLDIHGGVLSLGNWTDSSGNSVNAFCLAFANSQNGQPSLLNFAATRQSTDWIWSHAASDESSNQINAMRLDSQNRLLLYNPANQTTPAIVLDPAGQSSFNGPLHIAPQGDLDMGIFTQQPQ